MESSPLVSDSPAGKQRGSLLCLMGLIVGLAGFVAAVTGPHVEAALVEPEPPQKISDLLAEAGDKFVGKMLDRVRGKQPEKAPPPPAIHWVWYFSLSGVLLGVMGATLGTVGWIQREDHRMAVSAIVIGALAVAWVYIVAAFVIALVIIFLISFYGTIGA